MSEDPTTKALSDAVSRGVTKFNDPYSKRFHEIALEIVRIGKAAEKKGMKREEVVDALFVAACTFGRTIGLTADDATVAFKRATWDFVWRDGRPHMHVEVLKDPTAIIQDAVGLAQRTPSKPQPAVVSPGSELTAKASQPTELQGSAHGSELPDWFELPTRPIVTDSAVAKLLDEVYKGKGPVRDKVKSAIVNRLEAMASDETLKPESRAAAKKMLGKELSAEEGEMLESHARELDRVHPLMPEPQKVRIAGTVRLIAGDGSEFDADPNIKAIRELIAKMRGLNLPACGTGRYHGFVDASAESALFENLKHLGLTLLAPPDFMMDRDRALGEVQGVMFFRAAF